MAQWRAHRPASDFSSDQRAPSSCEIDDFSCVVTVDEAGVSGSARTFRGRDTFKSGKKESSIAGGKARDRIGNVAKVDGFDPHPIGALIIELNRNIASRVGSGDDGRTLQVGGFEPRLFSLILAIDADPYFAAGC